MTETEVLGIFEKFGVLVDGHFLYRSGLHGRKYVNKDAIFPHVEIISRLCARIATEFRDDNIEVVIGPAIGGVIISQWVTFHLNNLVGHPGGVLAVYAEKQPDGTFAIKRGYDKLVNGKRTLVVEDVMTTALSAKGVIDVSRAKGAIVKGLGLLWNRGGITPADVGVAKLYALINRHLETWEPDECPLCRDEVPINSELGKGKEISKSS